MGTVVGNWRLKIILLLFILLTSIYIMNGFLWDIDVDQDGYIASEYNVSYNQSDETQEVSDSFIDVVFGIGDFLTFGNITNTYARIFINLFVSICWIVIGYVMYTFLKEWIPFV